MKKILGITLALTLALGCTGCGSAGSAATTDTTTVAEDAAKTSEAGGTSKFKTLNVGTMPLTVGVPVQYAMDQGYFEEAGLDVNIEYFATGAPINEAIAANEIDIACSGFASVYSLANANCIWLADVNTTGGMGLFARADSDIVAAGHTLSDLPDVYGSTDTLKKLQILEPLGTSVQYMTECYAEKFGLTPNDINQVNMEYASAYQAYQTGEGDLAAMNPPYSYQMEEGGYVEVCSFEDATGVNLCDGCFARGEVVENRSEEVQLFVDCLVKAMDDLQDNNLRSEYTSKFYTDNGQDFTEDNLKLEIEDRQYLGTEAITATDYKLGEAWVNITDFLVTAEKITADNAPNVADSINPSYISTTTGTTIKK